MDKDQARRAFDVWASAIRDFLSADEYPRYLSIQEAANQYGTYVSTPEDIEDASEFFNWDVITSFLEQHSTPTKEKL